MNIFNKSKEISVIPETQAGSVMESLNSAIDKGVDAESLEKILDMQERILDRSAKEAYTIAMVAVQSKMPVILKNRTNDQTNSDYSDLKIIIKIITPIYTEEGFSLSFGEENSPIEDHKRIICDVMHSAGHSKQYHTDLPLDMVGLKGNPNKTKMHASGSTMRYGQRYLTCMIFNLNTGNDDDGNAGGSTDYERITEDQANQIHAKITDNDLNMELFKNWIKGTIRVESIEDIPAEWFDNTMKRIEKAIELKDTKE